MKYTIEVIDDADYKITFGNYSPISNIFYEFEISDEIDWEKLEKAISNGFKNIPHLTFEIMYPVVMIHYIPNNLIRIIDRMSKIVNKFSKSLKMFDNYENLFMHVLLPYGKFLSNDFDCINTEKETCNGLLYNKKIIDEQIYNPKISISNNLSYLLDDDYWLDDSEHSENNFDESKINQENLETNQNINLENSKPNKPNFDIKLLQDTIEQQRYFIKTLQNEIENLKYLLSTK